MTARSPCVSASAGRPKQALRPHYRPLRRKGVAQGGSGATAAARVRRRHDAVKLVEGKKCRIGRYLSVPAVSSQTAAALS